MAKIEEEAEESRKRDYVNFKRVVWHSSFYELLDSIQAHSQVGFHIVCADGVKRHFYPVIIILSADYEEQYEWFHISYLSSYAYNCVLC